MISPFLTVERALVLIERLKVSNNSAPMHRIVMRK